MNWFSMLALCATANSPTGVDCDSVHLTYQQQLTNLEISATDIDAIARTAYAEAENQGTIGLSGVVFTILNRKISGQFANSIEDIVNSTNQFEPVTNAGGWQKLPQPTISQLTRIETILELAQSGHMTDPTGGALYFQNSEIVANRVNQGTVSPNLVHFGGSPISATIADHTFYALMCQRGNETVASIKNTSILRRAGSSVTNGVKQFRGGDH
jgi:spore germination cell wall hydrolase CwlJ-like protein